MQANLSSGNYQFSLTRAALCLQGRAKGKFLSVIAILAVLLMPRAFGQTLLTEAYLQQGLGTIQITNSINVTVGIGLPPAGLFDGVFVQAGDVGHTYMIGPGNDTDFVTFVSRLTDGKASEFSYVLSLGASKASKFASSEVDFFTALPPGNNGVDLGGFEIDHVTLRFDTIEIATPGTDPNGDGVWTDCSYSATFSVYGQPIPEPTSLGTFCFGLVALCAWSKWLRRSAEE